MNFINKINYINNISEKLDGIVRCHISIPKKGASKDFIDQLKSFFPNLPEAYIKFLETYDGLSIGWLIAYSSPAAGRASLLNAITLAKEAHELDLIKIGCCPIGEDGGADLYCINKKGEIVMFDAEIYEEHEPLFIAESFESFIDNCVLGKRYTETGIDNSTFHNFLKAQGWA